MNFPLIPLVGFLGVHNEISNLNIGISGALVFFATIIGVVFLVGNAFKSPINNDQYKRAEAQIGLGFLGIAILVAVVGVTYIIAVAVVVILLYWVIYRFLILNIKAAFCRKKPKNTDNIDIPDDY